MQDLGSSLLGAFPSLFSSLLIYLEEIHEFFEFIHYFRAEDKAIEISEFGNSLRCYETVDAFLDDLVNLIFLL